MHIQSYESTYQSEIYPLHLSGFIQNGGYVEDSEMLDHDLHNIQEIYLENHGAFLLVIHEGSLVGMGAFRRINDEVAEIKRMRVGINMQRQGIGKLILDTLIQKAEYFGYKKLILDTFVGQIPAQKLYQSRGFKEYKRGDFHGNETIFYLLELPIDPKKNTEILKQIEIKSP